MAGQTFSSFNALGDAGIKERIPEKSDLDFGVAHADGLISLVRTAKADRAFVGDDFVPDTNLYNAIGTIYPLLDREQKHQALQAFFAQFDMVNYVYVQSNHTAYIREPILLSDIEIARPVYGPGLEHASWLIKQYKRYSALKKDLMSNGLFKKEKVPSDFCLAYALLRKDRSRCGKSFAKDCHPEFLERVLKAIVNLRFARAKTDDAVKKGTDRLKELLPETLHDRISKYYELKDWPNPDCYR